MGAGVLACCAGQAACCAGQACCQCLCGVCSKAGLASKNFAKVGYVMLQIVLMALSLGIMASSSALFERKLIKKSFANLLSCPKASSSGIDGPDDADKMACLGASNIIRMSFALFVFHAIMFIMVCSRAKIIAAVHDGFWPIKMAVILVIYVGSMWISNEGMQWYMWLCRFVGFVFLVYQALLMLVVAYKVNGKLVENVEVDETCCSKAIIMSFFLTITGFNVYSIVYQYQVFSCGGNITIQTFTVIGCVLMYGLVLLRARDDASVLTSAIAASYCLYLQWSALSSDTSASCNDNYNDSANAAWQIGGGLLFTFVSLLVISSSTMDDDEEKTLSAEVGSHMMEKKSELDDRPQDTINQTKDNEEAGVFAISNATIYFQLLMMVSAMYMAMLCTNWGKTEVFNNGGRANFFEPNMTSYWLKIIAQWVTMSMYLLSLLMPILFPDREYN